MIEAFRKGSIFSLYGKLVTAALMLLLVSTGPYLYPIALAQTECPAIPPSDLALPLAETGDPDEHGHEPWERFTPDITVPTDFPTIQSAVNNACPGNVILVLEGAYYESVTITTVGLYLIGQGAETTRIISTYGPSIVVLSDGVSVDSFQIEGGVIVSNADNVLITRNRILATTGTGSSPAIQMLGSSMGRVSSNEITGGPLGIQLDSLSTNNRIGPTNRLEQVDMGIWIGGNSGNNEVFQNTILGGSVAVHVEFSPYVTVHHNEASQQTDYCVQYRESDFAFISRNQLDGLQFGISTVDSLEAKIHANTISARAAAITLENADNTEVDDNSVMSQQTAAIVLQGGTSHVSIHNNELRDSPTGIYAIGVAGLSVTENLFGNGGTGLEIFTSDSSILKGNYFRGQSGPGLRLVSSQGVTVLKNQFLSGHDWAVVTQDSPSATIMKNTVLSSEQGAFLVNNGPYTRIRENEISSSGTALRLVSSPNAQILENTLFRNTIGIDTLTSGASIHHNWLLDNQFQVSQTASGQNVWQDGSGHGNFWSDYKGQDLNFDGIGDNQLPHHGVDFFPIAKRDFVQLDLVGLVQIARQKVLASNIASGVRTALIRDLDHLQRAIMRDENATAAEEAAEAFGDLVSSQTGKKIPPGIASQLSLIIGDVIADIGNVDFDGDGLLQSGEESEGTDPHDPDTDGDLAGDGCEHIFFRVMDPLDPADGAKDPDNDLLPNFLECLFLTDPGVADYDSDSFNENMVDGAELSYWSSRDEIEPGLVIALSLGLIDPWEIPDPLDADDHAQINLVSSHMRERDVEGDGFRDGWEVHTPGFDPLDASDGGLNDDPDADMITNEREHEIWVRGLGTDPLVQDVLIEVDWLAGFDPRGDTQTFLGGDPDNAANWDAATANGIDDQLEPVWYAFQRAGLNIVLFYDDELPASTDGGDRLITAGEANTMYDDNFDGLSDDSLLGGISRYGVLVDQVNIGSCNPCSGITPQVPGDFFLVAAGDARGLSQRQLAATFMHEMGHALGLGHGGNTDTNYKPNYNSVMNYRFQFPGVDHTGDMDCDDAADGVVDYSYGLNPALDEGPYSGAGSPELNANCSGTSKPDGYLGELGPGVSIGLCSLFDGLLCLLDTNLYDFDDWGFIQDNLDNDFGHGDL